MWYLIFSHLPSLVALPLLSFSGISSWWTKWAFSLADAQRWGGTLPRSAEGHVFRWTRKKILNNRYVECFDRSFMVCGSFSKVEKGSLYSLTSKVSFQIRRKKKTDWRLLINWHTHVFFPKLVCRIQICYWRYVDEIEVDHCTRGTSQTCPVLDKWWIKFLLVKGSCFHLSPQWCSLLSWKD